MPDLFANQILEGRTVGGRRLVTPAVNEHHVRAAVGTTIVTSRRTP